MSYLALDVHPSECLRPGNFKQVAGFAGRKLKHLVGTLGKKSLTSMVEEKLNTILVALEPKFLGEKTNPDVGFVSEGK